ncbi:MAG TPA: MATE family efflux transporter [Pirellulales bacterium]|nr:MATE family efflux transporter [Pirellulales bacterium]
MESSTLESKIQNPKSKISTGGVRETLAVALPLIASTVSWTIMIFTDRVFLTWYSPDAVAAALPAGNIAFTIICFPLGLASYVNTFVAQYHGANRPERIGPAVWQALFIGMIAAPLAMSTIAFAPRIIAAVGHAPEVARYELEYYQAVCWGESTLVMVAALSAFFTGRSRTRTVMVVDSSAAALNVLLDYLWIFGRGGFPEMGVAGAAWATTVATWARLAVYLYLWWRPELRRKFKTLSGCRFDRELFGRLVWFGFPNGTQYLFEMGAFTVFLVLVGQMGKHELAASNLSFNLNSFAFMPILGVGLAASTLVGQHLGENKPRLAERSTWSAFQIGGGLMVIVASLYLFAPDLLLFTYSINTDPEKFAELHDLVVILLRFVAFYCFFDAMNIIFSGALKGAGDTAFVLATTLVVSLAVASATWIGVKYFHFGLYWCWSIITAWVYLLGVIFLLRFLYGPWRGMRVIEKPDLHLHVETAEPERCPGAAS